jgi:hypothetical protein
VWTFVLQITPGHLQALLQGWPIIRAGSFGYRKWWRPEPLRALGAPGSPEESFGNKEPDTFVCVHGREGVIQQNKPQIQKLLA